MNGWADCFRTCNFPIYDGEYDDYALSYPVELPSAPQDLSELRKNGFLHWNDCVDMAALINLLKGPFWTLTAQSTVHSILANVRLRSVLRQAFGPGPYVIRHCSWWSSSVLKGNPIYFKRNADQVDQSLGLHIPLEGACIHYFAGSHKADWPATESESPWFINDDPHSLQQYIKQTISNGL